MNKLSDTRVKFYKVGIKDGVIEFRCIHTSGSVQTEFLDLSNAKTKSQQLVLLKRMLMKFEIPDWATYNFSKLERNVILLQFTEK